MEASEDGARDRADRMLASIVIATLLRIRQETDNRSVRQNPREELEERRRRAAATADREEDEGNE